MRSLLAILVAVVCYGIEYHLVKKTTGDVPKVMVGCLTFGITAAALAVLHGVRFYKPAEGVDLERRSPARCIGYMVAIGGVAVFINGLLIWGTSLTTAESAAALGRTDVLFTMVLSALVFREHIRPVAWLFAAPMVVGVFLVMKLEPADLRIKSAGDLLILGNALLFSVNAFIIKRALRIMTGPEVAMYNCAINAVVFAVAITLWPAGAGHAGGWAMFAGVSRTTWTMLLALGGLNTVFLVCYYFSLGKLPVWEVRLLLLGIPVVSAIIGWVVLGQVVDLWVLGGIVLILASGAGIILTRRREAPVTDNETEVDHAR
ncbi:MAG: DMT family transporter [Planctomycetota bacterium]